jgi:predicted  nucleic acid-binding Zn-ribbon protein
MKSRSIRYIALLLAILIGVSVCSIETDAQRRRWWRARRAPRPVVTNPAIAAPGSEQDGGSERIISTADENPADANDNGTQPKKKSTKSGEASMQQTIDALSNQVNRLNDKLSQMQENERSLIDMERLTRAEQRAESVRGQMLDTESKLADLQARMDQVDYALKPENIDRSVAGYGTVHPEDARDTRRHELENEKARLQVQITLLENSRTRLQASLSTAEAEVDLLRRRMDQQQLNNADSARPEPTATPYKP